MEIYEYIKVINIDEPYKIFYAHIQKKQNNANYKNFVRMILIKYRKFTNIYLLNQDF
jgi:hypothetical protein